MEARSQIAKKDAEIARLRKALTEIVELDASIVDCDCCRIASEALEGK
jgi:hypothetical protein